MTKSLPRGLFALLATLAGSGCTTPPTVGTTNRAFISNRVSGQVVVWARALNNRSLDTLALLYSPERDVTAVGPDGVRKLGWPSLSAGWQAWFDRASQLNIVASGTEIEVVEPKVAVALFNLSTDVVASGDRVKETQRVTQVWHLDADGRWRIAVEHRSIVPSTLR